MEYRIDRVQNQPFNGHSICHGSDFVAYCYDGRGPDSDGITAEKRARMVKFVHEWWNVIRTMERATYAFLKHQNRETLGWDISRVCGFDDFHESVRQVEEGDRPKMVEVKIPISSLPEEGFVTLKGEIANFSISRECARALRDEINRQLGSPV